MDVARLGIGAAAFTAAATAAATLHCICMPGRRGACSIMRCHRSSNARALAMALIILQINFQIGNFLRIYTETHIHQQLANTHTHKHKYTNMQLKSFLPMAAIMSFYVRRINCCCCCCNWLKVGLFANGHHRRILTYKIGYIFELCSYLWWVY